MVHGVLAQPLDHLGEGGGPTEEARARGPRSPKHGAELVLARAPLHPADSFDVLAQRRRERAEPVGPHPAYVAGGDVAHHLPVEGTVRTKSGHRRRGGETEPGHALERVQRGVVRVHREHGLDRHAELGQRRSRGERGDLVGGD